MRVTIRERLSEVASRFKQIDVALFSSFTFNAASGGLEAGQRRTAAELAAAARRFRLVRAG